MSNHFYNVVVAEDEELLLNNLVKKIHKTDLGFRVIGTAMNGLSAFELIAKHEPEILITDIRMPAMDGLALIHKVSQLYPSIKFVIISGFSEFEYAKEALQLHVYNYILKPIDEDELYKTLNSLKYELELKEKHTKDIFKTMVGHSSYEIANLLKDYLIQNYTNEINLKEIANSLNYSAGYLCKIFCQEYDCTPSKYVISLRMQKAKEMLTHNPELTIGQIGELVGYKEQGYFSRSFKKYTGKSPFEYREHN